MNRKPSQATGIGLDIGTATVRCVVGIQETEAGGTSVIGVGEAPNHGVRKGIVVDIEETVSAISQAVEDAQRMAGLAVNHATVGVNGAHIIAVGSHGIVAIGAGSRDITEADLARVEEAATIIQLPPNREIIQAFPRSYQIDGQDNIKDPVGMNGVRLEVDTCLITAATPFVKNLVRCAQQAGVSIDSLAANPLAASLTLADKRLREQGSVIIDIGASTTGLAVFEEGELMHLAVLPLGGAHITNDLAIGLRTEIETAEMIKLEHTKLVAGSAGRNLKVKELSGKDIIVSSSEINMIANARLDEIFEAVTDELKKIKRDGMLPGGAVLCGGTAKLAGIDDVAKETLRLPVHIGKPQGFAGLVEKINSPAYATALGLMMADLHSGASARSTFAIPSINGLVKPVQGFIQRLWRGSKKA